MKKTFYYALTLLSISASLPLEAVSSYDYALEHAYPQEQEARAEKKKKPAKSVSIYDHLLSQAYKENKEAGKTKKKKKGKLPNPKTGYDHMVYHPYQDTFQPVKKSLPFQKRVKQEEARREEISGTTESIASSMMGWGVGMTIAIMILSGVVRQSKNPNFATGTTTNSSSSS